MRVDTVFANARIRTLDAERPVAGAVGVLAGRIVGLDEELDGVDADRRVNVAGAVLLPGFHDAHRHLLIAAKRRRQLDVGGPDGAEPEGLVAAIAARADELPPGAWLLGAGFQASVLGTAVSAADLDWVAGGRPVWLEDTTGHVGLANTRALELAGLGEGWSGADGEHLLPVGSGGRPSGLVREQAVAQVRRTIGPTPPAVLMDGLRAAAAECLADGITSATEAGVGATLGLGDGPMDVACFLDARDRGWLPLRLSLMPFVTALHVIDGVADPQRWRALDLGVRSGLGDDRLRIGAVKLLVDGSLRGRTAAMCCDYHGTPGERGALQIPPETLTEKVRQLHRSGWQIAAHAIGDAAVDAILSAFETVQAEEPKPARHRIEHVSVLTDDQIRRIAASGIVAVPQGRFVHEMGDAALEVLGADRARLAYRVRSLMEAGVVVAGSSDAPVVDGSPLRGIEAMVTRRTAGGAVLNAEEAITPLQALRAYTQGSAYAHGEESIKGAVGRGRLADFVLLSDDPLAVAPAAIGAITVEGTVVGGEVVHDPHGFAT